MPTYVHIHMHSYTTYYTYLREINSSRSARDNAGKQILKNIITHSYTQADKEQARWKPD